MNENRKILVLRYGVNILSDCIEKHIEVLNEIGYCWFGKIGRAPSVKVINEALQDEKGIIILYSKYGSYICDVDGFQFERPKDGYPCYYDELIFNHGMEPEFYVRIKSIKKIEPSVLSKYFVCSSGNPLPAALNKSMNSFFVVNEGTQVCNISTNRETKAKKEEKISLQLDINDCRFRQNGICNRRGFVSYQFECIRPSSCAGQKR